MKLTWREYWQLWQMARRRLRSEEDYRAFQAFQASQLINYFEQHGIRLSGRIVLDLGSGVGGYSEEFARRGACVVSVDLVQPQWAAHLPIYQIVGDALMIPLGAEKFDFVFCASLIEHVAQPAQLLSEIERVLKAGGACYLSFPPYYSPRGGHEFAPFHYLGERIALRIVRRRKRREWEQRLYDVSMQPQSFADLFRRWGLYKMTIAQFRRLLNGSSLRCRDLSTRYFPISFIRVPWIGEVLTWHAQCLLVKPEPSKDHLG